MTSYNQEDATKRYIPDPDSNVFLSAAASAVRQFVIKGACMGTFNRRTIRESPGAHN